MRLTTFDYLGVTLRLFESHDFRKALELGFSKKQLNQMRKANRLYSEACKKNGLMKESVLRDRKVGLQAASGEGDFRLKSQNLESHMIFAGKVVDYATKKRTPKKERVKHESVFVSKLYQVKDDSNKGIDSPDTDALHHVSNECVKRAERFLHDDVRKPFRPQRVGIQMIANNIIEKAENGWRLNNGELLILKDAGRLGEVNVDLNKTLPINPSESRSTKKQRAVSDVAFRDSKFFSNK